MGFVTPVQNTKEIYFFPQKISKMFFRNVQLDWTLLSKNRIFFPTLVILAKKKKSKN